ncbi:MAG: DUF1015 domain-containing protein [Pyrinomonadaceae bacterium]
MSLETPAAAPRRQRIDRTIVAILKPFRALRPIADKARHVSCVPYDVVHESEVRDFIRDHPLSFLRVTRAEAEFPESSDPQPADVFAQAKQNLQWFIEKTIYAVDSTPALYVYRLASAGHVQTGVVGCCSLGEYDRGVIKKHENVRPDKVADRTAHMLAVRAQTGLIFLTFRNTGAIAYLFEDAVKSEPIYDFVCTDGVDHKVWRLVDIADWVEAFLDIPELYIADGHHRVESAKLARDTLRTASPNYTGGEEYNFVVAGLFPAEDLQILPYNRVVKDLNGLHKDDLFEKIRENFVLTETIDKTPDRHGEVSMYFRGQWYKLRLRASVPDDPIKTLDVSILQDCLLGPVLGIDDPRTDDRIIFIGGARGTNELERIVDSGEGKIAFSLFATTMDDLFSVSDIGETMPPKSTWFEPKLKDGLLVHQI